VQEREREGREGGLMNIEGDARIENETIQKVIDYVKKRSTRTEDGTVMAVWSAT
jgi:hypothetical protein